MELAAEMRAVIHRLVKILRKQTRNTALLSLTERSTLGLLYQHASLLPSELAGMEKVTTQSMSQVINHLFELGYIHRTPSGDDKRKTFLSLTGAGNAYVEQIRQEKQEWLFRALHERVPAGDKIILKEALQILKKLTDD
jgi:DNA-binding MarR family transcriptional regulator